MSSQGKRPAKLQSRIITLCEYDPLMSGPFPNIGNHPAAQTAVHSPQRLIKKENIRRDNTGAHDDCDPAFRLI